MALTRQEIDKRSREKRKLNPIAMEKYKARRSKYQKEYAIKNSDRRKEYKRNYNEINKDKIKQHQRALYLIQRQERLQKDKEYKSTHKQERYESNKRYRQSNKDYVNSWFRQYNKNRTVIDPEYKLAKALRSSLYRMVSKGKMSSFSKKSNHTLELLGCSIPDFFLYMETNMQYGMNWNNYGLRGWHIDHIRPCASFDLNDQNQIEQCFHYTNLQPLWWYDNLAKGSKVA